MYVEVHQSLPRHPKLLSMCRTLEVDRYKAIGHLASLWLWGLDLADPGGNLPPGTNDEAVADAAGWPVEDAPRFVKVLKAVRFFERGRGYQFHDWDVYVGKYHRAKEQASKDGDYGNHVRWHVKRSIIDLTCEWCNSNRRPESGGDSGGESDPNRVSSQLTLSTHSPSVPSEASGSSESREASGTSDAERPRPAAMSRYNLDTGEWNELYRRFPGVNVQAFWHEWVEWIEGSEEERRPKDKVAAFIGFLNLKVVTPKSPTALRGRR